ncbi:MAG: hypothetical protein ACJ8AT_01975 [Hyalangium sp.]|uniref:hypothetical protein n=1 Tax=Hyalangium sp. TaxID=2028555 RepID=UPI00389AB0C4
MNRVLFMAVTAFFVLAGCGSTDQAGDSCSTENSGSCTSSTEALFCNDGKFRAVPCSGPSGCTQGDKQFVCDFSRAKPGEACPKSVEGSAQCDVNNADQDLKCVSGTWQAQTCKACTVQSGNIVCSP